MSARREVEFPWVDGTTVRSRPTLLKLSQVETRFGSALKLIARLHPFDLQLTTELIPLLTIILRGCDGVPKREGEIMEALFDMDYLQLVAPAIEWLGVGFTVDNPPPAKDTPEGN